MTKGLLYKTRWLLWSGSIVVIGYILFPRIDRAKTDPHKSSAVAHLRVIAHEQQEFSKTHHGSFATALDQLPDAALFDHAYMYSLEATQDKQGRASKYVVTASPAQPGKTGHQYFFIDETGTIRYEKMRPVNAQSRVLQ